MRDRLVELACRGLRPFFPARQQAPSLPQDASFLVIKPCCLGDVLFATAAAAALRAAFPQARMDFAVGSWSRVIVQHNPHINDILDCGPVGSGAFGLRAYLCLVNRIRGEHYTAALVLDRSPLLTLLPYLAGIPIRAGVDSAGRGFSLTHGVPVAPERHEAQLYLDVVRALGIEVKDARLHFQPTDRERAQIGELCRELGIGQPRRKPLVLIHPGGGENPGMVLSAKRWPAERLAALADRLAQEKGAQVILVGGPRDEVLAAATQEHARTKPKNLAGKLSLGELAALMEGASLYIGHDTGATHLAVAMGTPVVALFGPTDPAQYGPFGADKAIAIWKKLDCSPCLVAGRFNSSCREPRCIEAITIENVWEAAERLLSTGNA